MSSVVVIGAGAWGTALAIQAARGGNSVTLWARDPTRAATIAASRENPHLPGWPLPNPIAVSSALPDTADLALLAVPTQHLRGVLGRLPPGLGPLVVCAKGVERETLRLPLEIVTSMRAGTPAAVLTGPNFAHEIAAGLPAAAVVAATDAGLRETVAASLGTPSFRLYGNDDPIGAQVGGAAKNVIAIAAGAVIGAGTGRERPRRIDHPRPGGAGAACRGARRPRGDGDGPVGTGRSAADLHRDGQPQLQPRAGARSRRDAGRRAGSPQFGHRGRGHGARPGGARPRGGYAGLRRGRIVAGGTHDTGRGDRRLVGASAARRMIRSVLTVGGWTMASRILGFARDMLIAAMLGAGPIADAFFVALKLPNLFRRLFGEGAFNAAFVPAFSGMLAAEGRPAARRFAEETFAVMAFWLGVLTIAGEVFMPQMMAVLAPGFAATPEKFALAVDAVAHHVPLPAADLPGRSGVGRAERARPLHRGIGVLRAVQRRLDRLHAVADALRADGRPCAGLGHHRIGRGAAWPAAVGAASRRHGAVAAAPAPHAADPRAAAAHAAGAGRRRRDPAQSGGRRDHRQPAAGGDGVAAVLRRPGAATAAGRDRHGGGHRAPAAAVAPGARRARRRRRATR